MIGLGGNQEGIVGLLGGSALAGRVIGDDQLSLTESEGLRR